MSRTPKKQIPTLTMRGLVVFPGMVIHFDVGREKSVNALKTAAGGERRIFLVAQRDANVSEPGADDVYKIGVVAELRQVLKTPDGNIRVLVEGLYKAKILEFDASGDFVSCGVTPVVKRKTAELSESEETAYVRAISAAYAEYCRFTPKMPQELYDGIVSEKSLPKLVDMIVFNTYFKVEDRQEMLELGSDRKRAEKLISMLNAETKVMALESEINEEVTDALDKNQRDYYLREQMKVISRQLGGNSDDGTEEALDYIDRIKALGFDADSEEKLLDEAEKLRKFSPQSQDYGIICSYLDTVLELPWNIYSDAAINLNAAQKQLDKDHYGLKKVKERILETIAVRVLNPEVKGQIICLVGPPGVGKTSIGRSIATAIGRAYTRISLGGVGDEAEIRGHRKTYIGAMPGRIVKAIKQAGTMNPVMVLDEIDKLGSDYKGDPSSALLEVLDPEQNVSFADHFLEIPMDLSKVFFITTANTTDTIPAPLLDRMEIIELSSYTREEKFNIAKRHLLPKQLTKHGESAKTLKITDKTLYELIDGYTREAGVRKLEQQIAALCRKAARKLVSGEEKVTVSPQNLEEYLGAKKFLPERIADKNEVGVVTGLAWTSVGGVTMPLEVLVMEGTGKIETTGSLGQVMTESGKIAVSLVRSMADKYGINPDFYKTKDLHIHAPEGAVPKDGPSAGVTMTTALVSALSGIAVRRDVAMTGEITLHGKVLPIGGLREKAMAAYKAGVKTVVIPAENKPDLAEVDDVVKENVRFVPAETIQTVLDCALVKTDTAPLSRPETKDGKKLKLPAEKRGGKSGTTVNQ